MNTDLQDIDFEKFVENGHFKGGSKIKQVAKFIKDEVGTDSDAYDVIHTLRSAGIKFDDPFPEECEKCEVEVPGFEYEYCCSGRECGCHGEPSEPCLCDECWEKY